MEENKPRDVKFSEGITFKGNLYGTSLVVLLQIIPWFSMNFS